MSTSWSGIATAIGTIGLFGSAAAAAVGVWSLYTQQSRSQVTKLGVWRERASIREDLPCAFNIHVDNRSNGPIRGVGIFVEVIALTQSEPEGLLRMFLRKLEQSLGLKAPPGVRFWFQILTVPAKKHEIRTITITTAGSDHQRIECNILAYVARDNFGRRWYIKRAPERGQMPKRLILKKTADYTTIWKEELAMGGCRDEKGLKIAMDLPGTTKVLADHQPAARPRLLQRLRRSRDR